MGGGEPSGELVARDEPRRDRRGGSLLRPHAGEFGGERASVLVAEEDDSGQVDPVGTPGSRIPCAPPGFRRGALLCVAGGPSARLRRMASCSANRWGASGATFARGAGASTRPAAC